MVITNTLSKRNLVYGGELMIVYLEGDMGTDQNSLVWFETFFGIVTEAH